MSSVRVKWIEFIVFQDLEHGNTINCIPVCQRRIVNGWNYWPLNYRLAWIRNNWFYDQIVLVSMYKILFSDQHDNVHWIKLKKDFNNKSKYYHIYLGERRLNLITYVFSSQLGGGQFIFKLWSKSPFHFLCFFHTQKLKMHPTIDCIHYEFLDNKCVL